MYISPKCSLAIHLLIGVHEFQSLGRITGDILASSAGCNPVVARNILSSLKKAGIIHIPRGPGGATMAMDADQITLWMIHSAVDPITLEGFSGIHPHPSPSCPVGWRIEQVVAEPYAQVMHALEDAMQAITLQHMLDRYFTISPELGFESAALTAALRPAHTTDTKN